MKTCTDRRATLRRALRSVLGLAAAGAAALAVAPPAVAEPWGLSGADYDGVLCRLGTTQVALGAWTVNGTLAAFATEDVTGNGLTAGPAPQSGTTTALTPGVAGFTAADIGALAYLVDRWGGGGPEELAELSADVARVAGGGSAQARCLGQGGTSASRAAARLETARRLGGPYTVSLDVPAGVRPNTNADVAVTVRTAGGAAVPDKDVTLTVGGNDVTAVTDAAGVAKTSVSVPAAASVPVTASVDQPTLVYVASEPPSLAAGAPQATRATATLRPVLHPKPAISVQHEDLLLSGGTLAPVASVTGTYGYSGSGTVSVLGPVARPAGGCPAVPASSYRGPPVWDSDFAFTGDGSYRPGTTPGLDPGCYAVRAAVQTTDSTPVEKASTSTPGLTVSGLTLSSAAANALAPAGGLRATVTGADAGGAKVVASIVARGPVPFGADGCTGVRFTNAGTAGTSSPVAATAKDGKLVAQLALPRVKAVGCYALVARSEVSLDGRSVTATTPLAADGTVTAVLAPRLTVVAAALSTEQGRTVPATVEVSGTHGFPGVVRLGLTRGETVPISGCADARFASGGDALTGPTTKGDVDGDRSYRFTSPVATKVACYALAAQLSMAGNTALTITARPAATDGTFLAGVNANGKTGTTVQRNGGDSDLRVLIVYLTTLVLMLVACGTIMVRAFRVGRVLAARPAPGGPLLG